MNHSYSDIGQVVRTRNRYNFGNVSLNSLSLVFSKSICKCCHIPKAAAHFYQILVIDIRLTINATHYLHVSTIISLLGIDVIHSIYICMYWIVRPPFTTTMFLSGLLQWIITIASKMVIVHKSTDMSAFGLAVNPVYLMPLDFYSLIADDLSNLHTMSFTIYIFSHIRIPP